MANELRELRSSSNSQLLAAVQRREVERENPNPPKKRKNDDFYALHDSLRSAKEAGWRNVTDLPLDPRVDFTDVTKLKNPGRRSQVTTIQLFRRIFSDRLLSAIVDGCTSKERQIREGKPGLGHCFVSDDVLGFVAMILDCCSKRVEEWEPYLRDTDRRVGLQVNRYKNLSRFFDFNYLEIMEIFNEGLKETIEVGGHGVVDESMLPWRGDSLHVICIPRKPKSTGFRLYLLCFPLAVNGQPVVYHLIPDLRQPTYGGREMLDTCTQILPEGYIFSLTADSFFGSITWLEAHKEGNYTLAISKANDADLLSLFTHDLGHHETRTFTNGNIILQVWQDEDTVITASTCYTAREPAAKNREGRYRGVNLSEMKPCLTVDSINHLQALPLSELQSLCKRFGLPSGGTCQDLAFRIGGRLPPSAPANLQPPAEQQDPDDEIEDGETQNFAKANSQRALKAKCLELGLSQTGDKLKLARRILKHQRNGGETEELEADIRSFLNPTVTNQDKPTVIRDYSLSFNSVDRFNKIRSYISYRPRCCSEKMRIFVGLVEVALIQAWTLTISWRGEWEDEEDDLMEAAGALAEELWQRNK